MYQVFQDGKPADNTSFPNLKYDCWKNSVFKTYHEAVFYAILWAWPYKQSDVTAKMLIEVCEFFEDNNDEMNMGMGDYPLIMSIREV